MGRRKWMAGISSGIIISVATIAAVCALGLAVISHMILNGRVDESGVDISMVVLLFLAAFLGGRVWITVKEGNKINLFLVGLIATILLGVGGFTMEGEFQNIIRNLVSISSGCLISTFQVKNEFRKNRKRKSGYR